jgi:DTW domain-containing protein
MSHCRGCGLQFQCICDQKVSLRSKLRLSLLTHENELRRETNTGKWLIEAIPNCHRFIWQRTMPDQKLLTRLNREDERPLLLFPSAESQPLNDVLEETKTLPRIPHFIVLDGTWQEAKKMERKSSWLNSLDRVSFTPSQQSSYRLRRNQQVNELCTLEVAIELLRELKEESNAESLDHFFQVMMASYQADKSGHKLHKSHYINGFGSPK